jgi:hypothetical protein
MVGEASVVFMGESDIVGGAGTCKKGIIYAPMLTMLRSEK